MLNHNAKSSYCAKSSIMLHILKNTAYLSLDAFVCLINMTLDGFHYKECTSQRLASKHIASLTGFYSSTYTPHRGCMRLYTTVQLAFMSAIERLRCGHVALFFSMANNFL